MSYEQFNLGFTKFKPYYLLIIYEPAFERKRERIKVFLVQSTLRTHEQKIVFIIQRLQLLFVKSHRCL